ncbi:hypothetical protein FRC10_010272 [Ceratobasidium sp. 414]|nr:hypothetical protein FRC10_010272 [Ceratobasidium sp. 414]
MDELGRVITSMVCEVHEGTLHSSLDLDQIARSASECLLGGAYITGFGVGHVDGVVNPDQNPNSHVNPRALVQSHVEDLKQVIMDPALMRDWETPIVLMISPNDVEPGCLSEIIACDPKSPGVQVPRLKVVCPHEAEIASLEFACAYHKYEDRWLPDEDLASRRRRLEYLRSLRPKATVINGNHRIEAIKDIGEQSTRLFHDLARKVQAKQIMFDTAEQQVRAIAHTANAARYRVEVYNGPSTPAWIGNILHQGADNLYCTADLMDHQLLTVLARNDDSRTTQGTQTSEKAWSLAGRFQLWMRKAKESGATDTIDQYNAAHQDWLKSISGNVDKERKRGGRRGEWAGSDPVDRLFVEPLTTQMVLDTCNAKPVYDNIIKPTLASSMLHEDNALATCQIWLATRLLLSIFNVARGSGFDGARAYIRAHPTLDALGDPAAVAHWRRLHSCPELRPPLLTNYTTNMQKQFDTLFATEMRTFRARGGDVCPGDIRLLLPLRRVFDNLSEWVLERAPLEESRKIATSLQLYARLPYDTAITDTATFYDSSALPAPRWISAALDEHSNDSPDAGYIVRSRGYAHLANLVMQAPIASTMESRLQVVITCLADPRLQSAVRAVQKELGPRIIDLLADCSVARSSSARVPILSALAVEAPETFGSPSELRKTLSKARQELQQLVQIRPFPSAIAVARHMRQFSPLEKVFYPNFWKEFPTQTWLESWDTSPLRKFQDVNSLVGWAIFLGRLQPLVNDVLTRSKEARWILSLHGLLRSAYSRDSWGRHLQIPEDEEPYNPSNPPPGHASLPSLGDIGRASASLKQPEFLAPQYAVIAQGQRVPSDLSPDDAEWEGDSEPPVEEAKSISICSSALPSSHKFYQKRRGPNFGSPSRDMLDTTTTGSHPANTIRASLPLDCGSASSHHDGHGPSSRGPPPAPSATPSSRASVPTHTLIASRKDPPQGSGHSEKEST